MRSFQLDANEISDAFLDALVERCEAVKVLGREEFDDLLIAHGVASEAPPRSSDTRRHYVQRRNEFRTGPLNRRLLMRHGRTLMPSGDGYALRNESLTADFFCGQAAKRIRNTTTVINRKIRFVQRNSGRAVIPHKLSSRFAENLRGLDKALQSMADFAEHLVRDVEEQHQGQMELARLRHDKAKLLEEANARLVAAGLEPVPV